MYPQPSPSSGYYAPGPFVTPSGFDPAPTTWSGMHDKNAGSWGDGWQGYAGDAAYGQAGQQGASNALAGLGYILGNLGAGAAGGAMSDPRTQQVISDLQDQCQIRAKQGVTEWMKENWPVLAFGAVALVVGNYITVSFALLQAGVRGSRLRTLSPRRS